MCLSRHMRNLQTNEKEYNHESHKLQAQRRSKT